MRRREGLRDFRGRLGEDVMIGIGNGTDCVNRERDRDCGYRFLTSRREAASYHALYMRRGIGGDLMGNRDHAVSLYVCKIKKTPCMSPP